jgi:multiple sugar transport system ATP-binding protein
MRDLDLSQGRYLPALVIDDLSRSFRGKPAIDHVDFTVSKASLTVILGAAGAGKTTTLRLIAGLDQPDSGRVILSGQDVGKWEPKNRNVAMIFDNLALYPNKTGFENIASPLFIHGESKSEIEEKVTNMAATLKVPHVLRRLPKTMSGGERQRIALGRALIRPRNLFLLDEPLSSLDAMLRIELRAELKRLQRELGYTFLLATPDFNEAIAIADTVIMLREGRIVQIDQPQKLYDEPADRDVASFVGAPQINLMRACYTLDAGDGYIEAAGARLPVPPQFKKLFNSVSCDFELGIRPENLRLVESSRAHILATLIDIEPLGLKSVLTVRNGRAELRLIVESAETQRISPGQNVGIEINNLSMLLAFDRSSGQRIKR